MASKYSRLPLPTFVGKHAKLPFPYFDEKYKMHLKVLMWVKVVGVWGNWLVGRLEEISQLRDDLKIETEIHFLPEDIDEMMAAPKMTRR